MTFEEYLRAIGEQCDALRAAAVAAGPDTQVPTCPKWTVQRLIAHVGRVHGWTYNALRTEPGTQPDPAPTPPEAWDDVLTWWDELRAAFVAELVERGPDAPAAVFVPGAPQTSGWWARRQAHEVAIHRLDAEHAKQGGGAPTDVPTLLFDPVFAADGVDELLGMIVGVKREPVTRSGKVVWHAADGGRTWEARLREGHPLEIGPVEDSGVDADLTIAGTADAVYRAVWRRPSTAVIKGDTSLLELFPAP
ncbi:uncharacterized protein (TIGR03083 family) [Herbihabitans rhizosphaerae]|uniref:Uncharacterized protein (TIGR03083 family) n=1 Tax=Herbihabitans rhizosphaerae TaxID=1872711 RepID=A0A4Q7L8A3_9PSEU|nr:maleylpyruvate isomerase N-terminal domain-containing protein [Herbihabitans rhizosphaerae]RZS44622.1 uncharacterized protein (TIGR03083 family) [Herbihabitans rhizosphaerae]